MQKKFIERAIELAARHSASGKNGPFGAVIVKNEKVVSEGWNQVVKLHDCTAHAEIVAIRKACEKLRTEDLSGCVLYSSCEPCPMCLAAAYWAHIDTVYFSANRQDAKLAGFDDDDIYQQISMPAKFRMMPCIPLLPEQGQIVLQHWKNNPRKITY